MCGDEVEHGVGVCVRAGGTATRVLCTPHGELTPDPPPPIRARSHRRSHRPIRAPPIRPARAFLFFQIPHRAKSHISGWGVHTEINCALRYRTHAQAALRYPSHAPVPRPACPSAPTRLGPPTGASARATHPPPRTGQSAPRARRAQSAAAASQPGPTHKNTQISTRPTETNTRIKGRRRRAGPAQLTRAPDPPTQKEDRQHAPRPRT